MNPILANLRRLSPAAHAADAALLSAFLAGDQGAFAALVRRYAGLVFATCRRVLRHQHDAEDAFQATFLVLARRAGDVWPREAVGAWLFGVAHRVALKARAARVRRTTREVSLEDVAASELAPADFDLAASVQGAVAKLPPVYRAAVVACDLDGLSRREAAARLGWSEGTLSGRLARARALLATRLRKAGVTLPVVGLGAVFTPQVVSAELVVATTQLTQGGVVAGAPAPVAALAEGVMTNMFVYKLKATAAVLFAACALVFGAVAASGDGPGGGSGGRPKSAAGSAQPVPVKEQAAPPAKPAPGPRGELARMELEVLALEVAIAAKGPIDARTLAQLKARLAAAEKLLAPAPTAEDDLKRLQGDWRVIRMADANKPPRVDREADQSHRVVSFSGRTQRMPFVKFAADARIGPLLEFSLDGTASPRQLTLTHDGKPVLLGIYEFTATRKACQACHAPDPKALGQEALDECLGLCGPGVQSAGVGLRLAFKSEGDRPTEFGGDGVIVLDLVRVAAPGRPEPADPNVTSAENCIREAERQLQAQQAQLAQAREQVAVAEFNARVAESRLAAAKKALADLQNPAPKVAPAGKDDPTFTVFVRPADGPEAAVRLKATGGETVLDAIGQAAPAALKTPDAVSVWVARGGKVLAVDLVALTARGTTTTNYVLKPGDRLFVQFAPGR